MQQVETSDIFDLENNIASEYLINESQSQYAASLNYCTDFRKMYGYFPPEETYKNFTEACTN